MFKSVDKYYRFHSSIYDWTRPFILHGRDELLELIPHEPTESFNVMDIGCGTGYHLKQINKIYPQANLTGLDTSSYMLNKAQNKIKANNLILINESLNETTFDHNRFDIIICSYSLTIIDDWQRTLRLIQDHLKPSGIFLCCDFSGTNYAWFRKWMNYNHVDINRELLPMFDEIFESVYLKKSKAWMGLWEYLVFAGRMKS